MVSVTTLIHTALSFATVIIMIAMRHWTKVSRAHSTAQFNLAILSKGKQRNYPVNIHNYICILKLDYQPENNCVLTTVFVNISMLLCHKTVVYSSNAERRMLNETNEPNEPNELKPANYVLASFRKRKKVAEFEWILLPNTCGEHLLLLNYTWHLFPFVCICKFLNFNQCTRN